MADAELMALVPTNKHDIQKARQLIAVGWPDALPALPTLLTWLEDMNWPVAQVLEPFIAQAGMPLVPLIRAAWSGNDTAWQCWLIRMLPQCAPEVQAALCPDLERLASGEEPADEDEAAVWETARVALANKSA